MKIKRILATVLTLAMLASFISVPVFAEEAVPTLISTAAGEGYICEDLGILVGPDEDGVTEDYLDTLAKRTQAAMVNLRLFGLEADALAFEGEETFADAALATEYWQPILEYLKANPDLGWVGDENGNFLPNDYITGQAFTKILLVALGYEYGLHFDWETTMDFATEIGMTALADKANDDLTVRDIAAAIIEALGLKTTGPTDVTLLTQLVLDGIIDEAAAVAAGFEVEEPALVIINAYASAVDEVTVLTSMEIPDGTPISLKKGAAGYVAVEVVDGTTLTLTTLFNLPAGSYTVTVGEETAEFEVMARYGTDLVIAAKTIYLDNEQDLEVSLLDQYGDPMSLTGTNYSVFNQSDGYVYKPYVTDTMVVDILDDKGDGKDSPGIEAGDSINVFIYDPVSMLTASKVLVVEEAPVLTEIVLGGVTPGDEDAAKIFEETEDNVLAIEGIDQYGNSFELTNDLFKSGTLQVLLSDEDVIAPMSVTFNEGDLEFYANEPGASLFTFIIPSEAFITTSEMITVYADPEAASIEIAGPVEAVYANETTTMPVTGFDQYGDAIVITGDEDIMFTTTVDISVEIGISADDTVEFTAALDGTTTVYYFLNGVFQGTFDVTVNEEAYPFQVVGINDVPTALLQGTEFYFDDTNIDVIDQYGRPVSAATISDSAFDVIAWTELDAEHIYADSEPFGANYFIAAPDDSEEGSDPVYIGIYNPDVDDITPESIYTFTAQAVGIEDLATYSLDVIADTLCSNDENWDNYDQIAYSRAKLYTQIYIEYGEELPFFGGESIFLPWLDEIIPYASPLIFKAYLEDGTEVNIMSFGKDGFILEELLDLITFSVENVELNGPMFFDYQFDPTVLSYEDVEGTCIAKAWMNGVAVAETTFEISKATPAVASITADPTTLDLSIYVDESNFLSDEDIMTQIFYMMEFDEGFTFEFIGEDEIFDSEVGFIIMSHFNIVDQYGVELPWEALYEMGEINIIVNYVETDDDVDMLVTVMTPDGVYYDTIRVTDIDNFYF